MRDCWVVGEVVVCVFWGVDFGVVEDGDGAE